MCVPGATMSGFLRPSEEGPRLEKTTMSLTLFASASGVPQPSAPPKACTFSEAPTVMTFLAVPGVPTVLAPGPSLPAAKTMTISWLPGVGHRASRPAARRAPARRSAAQSDVVAVAAGAPQLLELMRMPSR